MSRQQIKMRVVDWFSDDTESNFYNNGFIQILQKQYDIIYSDEPDFLLYGPCGYEHLRYECVRIFYTPENIRPDYNIADYSIDFDYTTFGDRHLRLPFAFWSFYGKSQQETMDNRISLLPQKTKFCGFVVSNNGLTDKRDAFFDALNTYKHVDSGGRWKNNIGGNIDNKVEWLKSYKFNLCFENSSYPGYLTEKLFDAFMAGCVPIYWGDTSLRCLESLSNGKADSIIMGGGGGQALICAYPLFLLVLLIMKLTLRLLLIRITFQLLKI